MERLRQRDLAALLGLLPEIYAAPSPEVLVRHLLAALRSIVPAEFASYNEINCETRQASAQSDPSHAMGPQEIRAFERLLLEHPIILHYHNTRDEQALRISDLASPSGFRRSALYTECFRPAGIAFQVAFWLPSPHPRSLNIALNRSRRDFSERERLLLNLLRPHLAQAYQSAKAFSAMQQEQALTQQALEELDRGVVVLNRTGRVRLMNRRARHWVGEYFGASLRQPDRLPEDLRRWVRHQDAQLDQRDDLPPAREPLVTEHEGRQLRVRHLCVPEQCLLLFDEQTQAPRAATLESFGLSHREAEVLAWVAEGKTNAEIGIILGASPRTVGKHLERIYQKLGVENRTAAALAAKAGPGS